MKSITYGYTNVGLPKRRGEFEGGPSNPNAFGGAKYSHWVGDDMGVRPVQ